MMFSMLMLLVIAIGACGGMGELWSKLEQIDPILISPIPANLPLGFGLFLVSWLVTCFGGVGQPHLEIGVAMMIGGILVAAVLNGGLGLSGSIDEVLPAMAASFLIYGCSFLFVGKEKTAI